VDKSSVLAAEIKTHADSTDDEQEKMAVDHVGVDRRVPARKGSI
jgi:hypothetical protein